PRNITDTYQAMLDTVPPLRHAIEPMFTFGPIDNYTRTNTTNTDLKHTYYFKGGVDLSAHLYGIIRYANVQKGRQYQILDANFSQYVKMEADFRHYMKLSSNSTLASRVMGGFGYSY